MYNFQINDEITPIFYICKEVWDDKFKHIIHESLNDRMCYLLVEPDPNVLNRYVEMTCFTRNDFYNWYDDIDKLLGIKHEENSI